MHAYAGRQFVPFLWWSLVWPGREANSRPTVREADTIPTEPTRHGTTCRSWRALRHLAFKWRILGIQLNFLLKWPWCPSPIHGIRPGAMRSPTYIHCTFTRGPEIPLYIIVDPEPWGPQHLYMVHSHGALSSLCMVEDRGPWGPPFTC